MPRYICSHVLLLITKVPVQQPTVNTHYSSGQVVMSYFFRFLALSISVSALASPHILALPFVDLGYTVQQATSYNVRAPCVTHVHLAKIGNVANVDLF